MFNDNGIYTPHYSIGYLHGLLTFWGALYSNTTSSQIAIFFSIALFTNAQKYYNFVFLAFFLWANSFCVLCFYWSILALQCPVSFCRTATRISCVYTYIPSLWTCSPIPALQVITEPGGEPPCAMQQLPDSHLFNTWWCVHVPTSLSTCPALSFPPTVSTSSFSTSASLQVGASAPFFYFPYIRVNIQYLFSAF